MISITTLSRSIRILLAVLAVVSVRSAMAQKPQDHHQVIQFTGPFDEAASKFIHEGVRDQDPTADVWIDVAVQSVLIRAHLQLDRAQLQAVVGQAGLQIAYLGAPGNAVLRAGTADPFAAPVYRNTGDPAADNARYEAGKKAFIAAHPDQYEQQLTEPER